MVQNFLVTKIENLWGYFYVRSNLKNKLNKWGPDIIDVVFELESVK